MTMDDEQAALDESAARARIGTRLGKYDVVGVLGVGGMASVLAAEHRVTRNPVAIKILHDRVAAIGSARARFVREASAWAHIQHPGVVRVLDIESPPDFAPYLVMERLDGTTLRQWESTHAPRDTLDRVVEMLDVLAAAHAAGVVHRDVKPENVFVVSSGGRVTGTKLLDFGIARVDGGRGVTRTGIGMGTLAYVSPEQAGDATEVTPASDVWSVGVLLHEILAGRRPIADGSTGQVMRELFSPAPLPSLVGTPGVPEALAMLVDACLSKDPGGRPPNAAVLRDRLSSLLAVAESAHAPRSTSRHPARGTAGQLSLPPLAPTEPPRPEAATVTPRRPAIRRGTFVGLAIGAAAFLAAVAAALGVLMLGGLWPGGGDLPTATDTAAYPQGIADPMPVLPSPMPWDDVEPGIEVATGAVDIETDLSEGTLYVNGEARGPVSDGMTVLLPPGAYVLEVRVMDTTLAGPVTVPVQGGARVPVELSGEMVEPPDQDPLSEPTAARRRGGGAGSATGLPFNPF